MNNLAFNNVIDSQNGVALSNGVLTITADKLTAPVVLTHKPHTDTNLQWKGKALDTIVVQFPTNGEAEIPKITIKLVDAGFTVFTEPRLTNKAGILPVIYPCIACNIVDPKTLSLAFTSPEFQYPITMIGYSSLWFNTTEGPFDPTVIIKK